MEEIKDEMEVYANIYQKKYGINIEESIKTYYKPPEQVVEERKKDAIETIKRQFERLKKNNTQENRHRKDKPENYLMRWLNDHKDLLADARMSPKEILEEIVRGEVRLYIN